MPSKKILVTGGAGYIGSHTCKELKKSGYEPIVFDNFSTGRRDFVKYGTHFEGDICETHDLVTVFRTYQPEAVVHFAALTSVPDSVSDPLTYYKVNFQGSLNLLEVMKTFSVRKFVFSSSAAVYGIPSTVPVTENAPLEPLSPYGKTKLMVENVLSDLEMSSVSLRYFNAAGASSEGELGEDFKRPSHLIPIVLKTGLREKGRIQIFGNDFPTPDGTCVRDYVHVEDLAQAHVLALNRIFDSQMTKSECFNLGAGRGYSVKEVISEAQKVSGKNIVSEIAARRAGDPPRLIADNSRASQILGWKPVSSDITTILRTCLKWMERTNVD